MVIKINTKFAFAHIHSLLTIVNVISHSAPSQPRTTNKIRDWNVCFLLHLHTEHMSKSQQTMYICVRCLSTAKHLHLIWTARVFRLAIWRNNANSYTMHKVIVLSLTNGRFIGKLLCAFQSYLFTNRYKQLI